MHLGLFDFKRLGCCVLNVEHLRFKMKNLTSERFLIPVSFGVIYLVWGSTYLANWYAIRDIPTFLMCGSRFFVAGLLLFVVSILFGAERPKWVHWKSAAQMGLLFFFIGNGGAVWALNYLDSGIAALIIASQPLVTVLLMWIMLHQRPSARTFIGIFIGLTGMVLLVTQDQFTSSEEMLMGIAVILFCVLGWGFASIKISQIPLPSSKTLGASMQMLVGGSMLLLLSLGTGEALELDIPGITPRGAWSWLYLTFFGAFIAFSAFNYLLLKTTPDKVSTATYVNPVVALLLGWGFNNEVITSQSLVAAAFLLTGVIFINTNKGFFRKKKKIPLPTPLASLVAGLGDVMAETGVLLPKAKGSEVIARIWQGQTPIERSDDYVEWTKKNIVPDVKKTPGNLGAVLHRRNEGSMSHLTFISYWENMEAVKRFAGEEVEKARFYPAQKELLTTGEEMVRHQTVMV